MRSLPLPTGMSLGTVKVLSLIRSALSYQPNLPLDHEAVMASLLRAVDHTKS